jgi:hypothetical protein
MAVLGGGAFRTRPFMFFLFIVLVLKFDSAMLAVGRDCAGVDGVQLQGAEDAECRRTGGEKGCYSVTTEVAICKSSRTLARRP